MSLFLENLWSVMLELSPWLLLGAAVSGLLHVLLPEGFIHRQLTGRLGVLKAVLVGIPLPLCSCGVIPAGISLKRDGASDGARGCADGESQHRFPGAHAARVLLHNSLRSAE